MIHVKPGEIVSYIIEPADVTRTEDENLRIARDFQSLVVDLCEQLIEIFVKFAVVFAGTLSSSWLATICLRRIPVVARMI